MRCDKGLGDLKCGCTFEPFGFIKAVRYFDQEWLSKVNEIVKSKRKTRKGVRNEVLNQEDIGVGNLSDGTNER